MKVELLIYGFITIVVLIAIVIYMKKEQLKNAMNKLAADWGRLPDKEFTYDQLETMRGYYDGKCDEGRYYIDDITWYDLDMDKVFLTINNTNSSVGQENLYYMLRNAGVPKEVLEERDRFVEYFMANKDIALDLQYQFSQLGYTKKISVYDYINYLDTFDKKSNLKHYACMLATIFSVIFMIFVDPIIGLLAFLISLSVSFTTYYKEKNDNTAYIHSIKYVVAMLGTADKIAKKNVDMIEKYNAVFVAQNKFFSKLNRNYWLIGKGDVKDSIVDVLLDYVKIITHIDLIKFNNIIGSIKSNKDKIFTLYENLGELEALIAVASYRNYLNYYSKPEFVKGGRFEAEDIYHPLIQEPVTNSISEDKSVLLTGSNASGKSTFLKTLATNAICSQTIYTSFSKKYKADMYNIMSSMALKDNIESKESYYMVEIKALKRIIDAIDDNKKTLCFVDEVLRGTNTVERIAASSKILADMANRNALCFAATHDIELTSILSDIYSNYHFEEEIINDDIYFNYHLYKGKATTRNAIKLLGIMGYSENIIVEAEKMASRFIKEGNWCEI